VKLDLHDVTRYSTWLRACAARPFEPVQAADRAARSACSASCRRSASRSARGDGGTIFDHLRHQHLTMWATLAGLMACVTVAYAAFGRRYAVRVL
jgi:hypothetical protein